MELLWVLRLGLSSFVNMAVKLSVALLKNAKLTLIK